MTDCLWKPFFDFNSPQKGKVNSSLNITVFKKHKTQKKVLPAVSHNIWRLFDVLTNFPITASETMRDSYL